MSERENWHTGAKLVPARKYSAKNGRKRCFFQEETSFMCRNRDIDVKGCVVSVVLRTYFLMLSAACKHSGMGLTARVLFDINGHGKKYVTLFLSASSLTVLDQCSFEYIDICGMVQSGQDGAAWDHVLGKPGDEDHTLVGNCAGNGFSFRRS